MVLNNLVANREAESCSDANAFRRESRIEDLRKVIAWNSQTCIAYCNLDRAPFTGSLNRDRSVVLDRLRGIQKDIHEHLVHLIRKTLDFRYITKLLVDADPVLQ